jgi:ACS family D-galactonate transporter-like MFS transporter
LAATQKIDIKTVGFSTLVIFGAGFVGEIIGGWIADKWREKGGNYNTVMRTMLGIAGIMTSISVFLLSTTTSLFMAITLLSVTLFFLRWGGLFWSIPAAISQREHVGVVGGCMNFTANLAGVFTPIYVGLIVSATGSYTIALIIFAIAGICMAGASTLINYNKKVGM